MSNNCYVKTMMDTLGSLILVHLISLQTGLCRDEKIAIYL